MSSWTINIIVVLTIYWLFGTYSNQWLIQYDDTALNNKQLVLYAFRGILIYCLAWIVILTIHDRYCNDYMRVLKADNREGYKGLVLLTLKLAVLYQLVIVVPANHYINRLMGILMVYVWANQKYVQTAFWYNLHSFTKLKMQFVCNFSMNQCTSLSCITVPLAAVIIPQLGWLPHFIKFFPIFCRFVQTLIVRYRDEYFNTIKYSLSLIVFGLKMFDMQQQAYYWGIAASLYSLYWDIFRDFRWKIRFMDTKNSRMDLPLIYLLLGGLYNIFAHTFWIFYPITVQSRGIIQIIRRVVWSMLRIQREQVAYFSKPKGNNVKDLFD